MKKVLLLALGSWLVRCSLGVSGMLVDGVSAQSISQRLQKAFGQFEADSQLKHAISSLYVINAKTGEVVFDKNSQVGLAGASTQKIVTAATAFELLGKGFRYKTNISYFGEIKENKLYGGVIFKANGDPTFGSWRYKSTSAEVFLDSFSIALKHAGIYDFDTTMTDGYYLPMNGNPADISPDGWIWQDIGNYYGANAYEFNWNENQFTVRYRPGDVGQLAAVDSFLPAYAKEGNVRGNVYTGKPGSGDHTYFYSTPEGRFAKGTVPAGVPYFDVSASVYDPTTFFMYFLQSNFSSKNDKQKKLPGGNFVMGPKNRFPRQENSLIYTHSSPSLDSIIYWFLKKSINLYGKTLVKTFAYEKQGFGSTDSGVAIVRKFWKEKGLDEDELNIYDGSGLSPLNRLTTHAQVEVLKYAKTKDWFPYFYAALPEYNGMKLKSGTISDVKGFCGYHTAKDGTEYIVSFLVNNYNGRTSGVVNKMYKVLDELK